MLRRFARIAVASAFALCASFAQASDVHDASAPLRVVATIEPLCMLAREVGGERVACTTLVPTGASPHAFEPRPSTMTAVAAADLLLRAGNGIDDWAVPLGNAGGGKWLVLGPACEQNDPACAHFWLDPFLALSALAPLEAALVARDPAGVAGYGLRKVEFAVSVFALDAELALQLAGVRGAEFVAFHPAWGGFAAHFGLRELGSIQDHGAEEPTPRRLAELITAARAANVRAVLVEPQLDPHTARIVAEELGARLVTVDPLGNPRDPERASYTALLRWNARQLAAALAEEKP